MSVCDLDSAKSLIKRAAVTIGMFDGAHLGHRALLDALKEEAARIHGQSVVLTFDRHPAELLRPDRAPKFINTLDQRVSALEAVGVDVIVVAHFDRSISEMSPREFFENILIDRLKSAVVVVGPDFRFGKNRAGNFARLAELGIEHGVAAVAIPPALIDGAPVSSTRIRKLLQHGAVEDAARLLGRPFVLEGMVVKGAGLGRKLGFPTANLDVEPGQLLPGDGVYTADIAVLGQAYQGVVSIGSRPTFNGTDVVVETYIIGFEGCLYGERLRAGFRTRLREQKKYARVEDLVEQMRKDVDNASGLAPSEPPRQVH
ncbi:MAG: bifunctional riboflavin kinase/FAD synthetase [Armatimonadota bacterium]|nr:bifunctional riboflavin kinase/FAD synthetase [Armatimonadota bacterium]